MRLPVAVSASIVAVACAGPQRAIVTVTTRTELSVAAGSTGAPPSVSLAPPTLDRLDPAALASLNPHGRWEESVAYGRVWIPFDAYNAGFSPYLSNGEWIASREGWLWQSGYVWGQIPFHYGRWVTLEGRWAWVPGSSWAPAWVDWRRGGAWVGWSPQAPLGAPFTAPFVYCNEANLRGRGLQARTVVGPAAVSLFASTTEHASGPPLPAELATVIAVSQRSDAPASAPRGTLDLAQSAPSFGPPNTLEPIPRALLAASSSTPATTAESNGRAVGVIREGDQGATLVLREGSRTLHAGYSTIPAAPAPVVGPARTPVARPLLARSPRTPSPAWDRSVATPPPVVDLPGAAVAPSYAMWGAPRFAPGGSLPLAPQPVTRGMGGLGSGASVPVAAPVTSVAQPVLRAGGGPPSGVTQGGSPTPGAPPTGALTLR